MKVTRENKKDEELPWEVPDVWGGVFEILACQFCTLREFILKGSKDEMRKALEKKKKKTYIHCMEELERNRTTIVKSKGV